MLNGVSALQEIQDFIAEREAHGQKITDEERNVLDIVKRDAIHAINANIDHSLYSEYDRLKLVELEYMYQVRGVRQVMPSAIFREGYAGYGNSWTGSTIRLLYPQDRKRGGRMSREPVLPIDKIRETAALSEQLVPLRINLATDKYRLKDRLLWNADDTTIPLELFVEITLEDYGLPLSLAPTVSKSLQEQISNHLPHIYPVPPEARTTDKSPNNKTPKAPNPEDSKETDENEMDVDDENLKSNVESLTNHYVPAGQTAPLNQTETPQQPKSIENTSLTELAESVVPTASDEPAQLAEPTELAEHADPSEDTEATKHSDSAAEQTEKTVSGQEISEQNEHSAQFPNTKYTQQGEQAADAKAELQSLPDVQVKREDQLEPAQTTVTEEEPKKEDPKKEDPQKDEPYDEDMRFTIKLDITIGHHQLLDQFEWDINNPDNDPELFGLITANDLALPLEFSTAIAHAIREQVQAYSKALFNTGYQFDGKIPRDVSLQNELAMPVNENQFLRRPELLPTYTPRLIEAKISGIDSSAHEQEVERREIRSRRRMGRSSRRGNHDNRPGNNSNPSSDVVFLPQEVKGPDVCTPLFSSALPGGLDRNLSILYMTVYQNDENFGGEKQDLVYYFHKQRRERNIPCVSQYERSLVKFEKPRWIVKLKLPKGAQV